jgi:lipopolysaccharide biosynthesis glycosyltransferase
MRRKDEKIIPIFYAVDDAFVKYTIVSIRSLIENADQNNYYKIYILNTGVSSDMIIKTMELEKDNFEINFVDIRGQVEKISHRLPLRDYYSKTTYFRLYIAELYPNYDKAIYIDSDTVVLGDISKLYENDIGDNYVGACKEQAMVQTEVYGNYVEKVMGISRNEFFNAGVLLINCKQFRKNKVLEQFLNLLSVYYFAVTQDEDYLNVICKDKIYWLSQGWNTEVYGEINVKEEEMKIIHYIMVNKPWHYRDCFGGEYFWSYAAETRVYHLLRAELDAYTDEERQRDRLSAENLYQLAIDEINNENNYQNLLNKTKRSPDRVAVIKKMAEYER